LRRAMMRVRPEYFAWPPEQRERYGVAIPEDDSAHLDAALLEELFGRTYASRDEAVAAARDLPLSDLNRWNETCLPLTGIGEDCFYLNECFAEGKSILDFEALRDFDEDDHRFQEQAHQTEDSAYVPKPYRGRLYLNWGRLYVDGRFTYVTLTMAAGYVYAEIDKAGRDLLDTRIPHDYVPGHHHGKAEGDATQWDMRVKAGGQEGILEELQHRIWNYQSSRYENQRTAWDQKNLCGVYLLDESMEDEANLHFVFTDKDALAAVRFRSFLRDCRALARPVEELHRAVDEEKEALARFVEEQHTEVVRTYDPKVARFRKRRKVMVMKGAFDKLE